ncbi:hypothetical protein EW145_g2116 [Phellinidium pouzarii]|uniref:C2H2-type domain-containing protein n=1 Tax=Phellinidium pouzarii TaxID=167371 RepID=A0A4S4LCK0_9AGAM|nr:hypothetical protein EW145_g2116 [Phellinidium pouzarii]
MPSETIHIDPDAIIANHLFFLRMTGYFESRPNLLGSRAPRNSHVPLRSKEQTKKKDVFYFPSLNRSLDVDVDEKECGKKNSVDCHSPATNQTPELMAPLITEVESSSKDAKREETNSLDFKNSADVSNNAKALKSRSLTHDRDICEMEERTIAFNAVTYTIFDEQSSEPGRFMCSYEGCTQSSANTAILARHVHTHYPDAYFCPCCNTTFSRVDAFDRHFRMLQSKNDLVHTAGALRFEVGRERTRFNLYFLGVMDDFPMPEDHFKMIAGRRRGNKLD